MSKEPIKSLYRQWVEKQLEMTRAVGQMLRHLLEHEQRIQRLEQEMKSKGGMQK